MTGRFTRRSKHPMILVEHRLLLSAGLSVAAGIILRSSLLLPVKTRLLRYVALERPAFTTRSYPATGIFLFTTPFLLLSMFSRCCICIFMRMRSSGLLETLPSVRSLSVAMNSC